MAPVLASCIIVHRDNPTGLIRSLKSLKQQTLQDWEVWVMDNGSQSSFKELVAQLGDERIHLCELGNQRSKGAARSAGLELCHGPYVCFMEPGDEFLPAKFERQYAYLKAHERVQAVSTGIEFVDATQTPQHKRFIVDSDQHIQPLGYPKLDLPVPFAPTLIATALAREIGFNTSIPEGDDFDFMLRLLIRHPCALMAGAYYICPWDKQQEKAEVSAHLRIAEAILEKNDASIFESLRVSARLRLLPIRSANHIKNLVWR